MYDNAKDRVARDRLALKLYLLTNDHDDTQSELDKLFHSSKRAEIERRVVHELDPQIKGFVEIEEL
jgi:hypothetical protein